MAHGVNTSTRRLLALTHSTPRCSICTPSSCELTTLHAHRSVCVVRDEQTPVAIIQTSQACDRRNRHTGWTPLGCELDLEGGVVTPAAKCSCHARGAGIDTTAQLDGWALRVERCYDEQIRRVQHLEHGEAQTVRGGRRHIATVMGIRSLAGGGIHQERTRCVVTIAHLDAVIVRPGERAGVDEGLGIALTCARCSHGPVGEHDGLATCRRDHQTRPGAAYAVPGTGEHLGFDGTCLTVIDVEYSELPGPIGPAIRAPPDLVCGLRVEPLAWNLTRCRSRAGDLAARQISDLRGSKPVDMRCASVRARETRDGQHHGMYGVTHHDEHLSLQSPPCCPKPRYVFPF